MRKIKALSRVLMLLFAFGAVAMGLGISHVSCAAADNRRDFIKAADYEDFAAKAKKLSEGAVGSFKSVVENGGEEDPYSLMRIILMAKRKGYRDFYCSKATVIEGPDKMFLLQFKSREDTKAAYEILKNDKNLVYAQLDRIVSICSSGENLIEWENLTEYENLAECENPVECESLTKFENLTKFGNLTKYENRAAYSISTSHNSWGVNVMKCDKYASYLKKNKKNKKIIVAVIDSGVQSDHSYLKGRVLSTGYDFVDGDSNPGDRNGHGTHVAGTVVDCTKSLKKVKILPVRVMDENGQGTTFATIMGVNYAVKKGAKVMNISIGGGHDPGLETALNKAIKNKCIPVVAAGNESRNVENSCPGHYKKCITVGAITNRLSRAYFSNYGSAVDVVAPGVGIKSCVPGGGYEYWDGTSMATPHVAGAMAMLKLGNPGLTASKAHSLLKGICTDLGTKGKNSYYGYGVINMEKAIKKSRVKPKSIAFKDSEVKLAKGKTVSLAITYNPSDTTEKKLKWSSDKPAVASVSQKGVVTAKREGTAIIKAETVNKKKAKCKIIVTPEPVYPTSITVTGTAVMDIGNVYQFTAKILPENATETDVKWKSSDTRVAIVDNTGLVTALGDGIARISVTAENGITASLLITVNPLVIQPTSITLNKTEETLSSGEKLQLIAKILPENATNTLITWASDNVDVAGVSYNGTVSAYKSGTALITATTANGLKAGCYIHVKGIPDEVYFRKISYTIGIGEKLKLEPVVFPEESATSHFRYASSKTSVATVNLYTGEVTGISEGEATITLNYGTTQEPKKIQVKIVVSEEEGAGGDNGEESGFIGSYKKISSAEELKNISLSGKYILVNNIDISGYDWIPIGSASRPFSGILDGNGYEITGLSINNYLDGEGLTGVFGVVTGTVKNLTVSGDIYVNTSGISFCGIGGITGLLSRGTLENCESYVNITVSSGMLEKTSVRESAGGLCGQASNATISKCFFYGNISIEDTASQGMQLEAGGISGYLKSTSALECENHGNIYVCGFFSNRAGRADSFAGGISGSTSGSTLKSCSNAGSVISDCILTVEGSPANGTFRSFAGGIVGSHMAADSISNCSNTGEIEAMGSEGVTKVIN